MKIKFKKYEELRALMTQKKSVPTIAKWDKTTYLGESFDEDIDTFLHIISEKEFKIEEYEVIPGKGEVVYRIQTSDVGHDGGYNTNSIFGDFCFTKDFIDEIENAPVAWFCRSCGLTVDPVKQVSAFDPKKTYAELGIAESVCPGCFTKTFREVTFS